MRREVSPYADCGEIAGPLLDAAGKVVVFRRVVVGSARRMLWGLVLASAAAEITFLAWLLAPGHWSGVLAAGGSVGPLGVAAFGAIAVVELVRLLHTLPLWVLSLVARDPVPMRPPEELRIAVLTTIVPSREPLALVAETLAAMGRIDYENGVVDVWIWTRKTIRPCGRSQHGSASSTSAVIRSPRSTRLAALSGHARRQATTTPGSPSTATSTTSSRSSTRITCRSLTS